MPTNQLKKPSTPSGEIKHLYLTLDNPLNRSIEYAPRFYAEVRIDFADVRTGFGDTISLGKAFDIHTIDADLLWTDDMVCDVDPEKVQTAIPGYARLRSLPDFVDAQFVSRMEDSFAQYLMRTFSMKIFRNFHLNLYSSQGESPKEFAGRCFEMLGESMRSNLDSIHDVFNRKLEQLKEKYLGIEDTGELEPTKKASQDKNIFHRMSERIVERFLSPGAELNPSWIALRHAGAHVQDLDERLASLDLEIQQAINGILKEYHDKAECIDEYIIRPNLRDIHLVRGCILWMPLKAS